VFSKDYRPEMTGDASARSKQNPLWERFVGAAKGLRLVPEKRRKAILDISPPSKVQSIVLDAEAFQNPRKAPQPPVNVTSKYALPTQAPSFPSPLELDRPVSFVVCNTPSPSLSNPAFRSPEVEAWKNKLFDMENFKAIAGLRELSLKDIQNPAALYRSLKTIGQGGWGTVEAALTIGTNARVAIKRVNLVDHPKKRLIINEIQVLKNNNHRNIVGYIDSYLWKGEVWIVMEYMAGGNLAEVVTACQMSEGHIAAVCREVFMNRIDANGSHWKVYVICTQKASSTVTSSRTMSFFPSMAMSS
jgi:hypothetical protein